MHIVILRAFGLAVGRGVVFSPRERCSLGSSSGFEVFVPGRQNGFGHDPVFRSAHLFRRTVSHFSFFGAGSGTHDSRVLSSTFCVLATSAP